jgi:DNA polymerase-3 subunit alpha
MVKIVNRQFLANQLVYDIGVEQEHNFLLANGLVASNCFNKSHSTAYAYVTYQTAYLKANYPAEYMAALLTASSDDREKIEKYRENCQRMGIPVESPDINSSREDFTPQGDKILFGLSAIKSLGRKPIENIIQAREKPEGLYSSLADFCSRVDLSVVKSSAIETLISCGAFDKIEANRRQLLEDLKLIIPWVQNRIKEKASGQLNIFDLLGTSDRQEKDSSFDRLPKASPIVDFSVQEKINLEKEHLGFYISEHPLKAIHQAARFLSPINLAYLENCSAKQKISAIGILTNIRNILTQKGDSMAFIQIEDVSGQAEGVVFPNTYEQIKNFLQKDARLIFWGKVEERNDRPQIVIDNVEPVETARMVILKLSVGEALDKNIHNKLKSILQEQSGEKYKAKIPVVALITQGTERQFVRLGSDFWIQDCYATVDALNHAGFTAYFEPLMPNLAS